MIVNDKFIYLHLQKTGGTFLTKFLTTYTNSKQVLGKHSTYQMIKEEIKKGKDIIGVIRNPFSWYVSHYHFQKEGNRFMFNEILRSPKDFGEYLKRILDYDYNKISRINNLNKEIPGLQYEKLNVGNLTFNFINAFCEKNESCFYNQNLINDFLKVNHMIKNEDLSKECLKFFNLINIPLSDAGQKFLFNSKKINTSSHNDYRYYYNDELVDLVKHFDYYLIKKYNYQFE